MDYSADFIKIDSPNEQIGLIINLNENVVYNWSFEALLILKYPIEDYNTDEFVFWIEDNITGTALVNRIGTSNKFIIQVDANKEGTKLNFYYSGEINFDINVRNF